MVYLIKWQILKLLGLGLVLGHQRSSFLNEERELTGHSAATMKGGSICQIDRNKPSPALSLMLQLALDVEIIYFIPLSSWPNIFEIILWRSKTNCLSLILLWFISVLALASQRAAGQDVPNWVFAQNKWIQTLISLSESCMSYSIVAICSRSFLAAIAALYVTLSDALSDC